MDQQLVREIIASGFAFLTSLAEAAKTTGEHLYMVLVRQQAVEGLMWLIGIPSSIVLWILGFKILSYIVRNQKDDTESFLHFFWFLGGFFITALLVLGMMQGLAHIINPEYYAIQFIINSVKGGK